MRAAAFIIGAVVAAMTVASFVHAEDKQTVHRGIYYGPEKATEYQKEQCKLDIYQPADTSHPCPVVVFFHGGGLYQGTRGGPVMTESGVILVAPSYRLSPKVKCPAYLEDAADAVAWTFKNIKDYGGDRDKIFVSGLSAGCYLSTMLAMDRSWLAARGADADKLAGLIAVSGQMITHFTIRKEMGLSAQTGLCDKYSPLYHLRKTPFPIFILCGDDDYPSRQEENRLFVSMMLRYANQSPDAIAYREYPGTHYNFFSAVPQKDMQQFVLEKSGLAEASGRFDRPLEKPKADLQLYARNYGEKTYFDLETNITGFDAVEARLPGSTGDVSIDPKQGTAVAAGNLARGSSENAEILLTKKTPVQVVTSLAEFVLRQGKEAAVTSRMKGGSTVRFWTENNCLKVQITAKDSAVFGSHNNDLWNGDALEVFVDRTPFLGLGQNEYPIKGKEGEVRQYIFAARPAPDGTCVALLKNKRQSETAATVQVDTAADAYTLTATIPLTEISPLAEPEGAIGISVQRCIKDRLDQRKPEKEYWIFGVSAHYRRLQYTLFTIEGFGKP